MGPTFGFNCPQCRGRVEQPIDTVRLVASLGDYFRIQLSCPDCGPSSMPCEMDLVAWLFVAGMPRPIFPSDIEDFQVDMTFGDYLAGVAEMEASE